MRCSPNHHGRSTELRVPQSVNPGFSARLQRFSLTLQYRTCFGDCPSLTSVHSQINTVRAHHRISRASQTFLECGGANATSVWEIHISAGVIVGIAGSGATLAVILGVIARNVPTERRSLFLGIGSAVATMGQITIAPVSQNLITDFGWATTVILLGITMGLIVPLALALRGKASDLNASNAGAEKLMDALHQARDALRLYLPYP